jgi:hypothetical protein
MAKNKFSVQAEQKILCSKEQSRNVRKNRFLAFRFPPISLVLTRQHMRAALLRVGGR